MALMVIPRDLVIAICRYTSERWLEIADVVGVSECGGCRSQYDDGSIQIRRPEQGRFATGKIRVDGEIVTPSEGPTHRLRRRCLDRAEPSFGGPSDTPDCAGGIPTRAPKGRARSGTRSRPKSASLVAATSGPPIHVGSLPNFLANRWCGNAAKCSHSDTTNCIAPDRVAHA